MEPLPYILGVSAINGTILAFGCIWSCTSPIKIAVGVLQKEIIPFQVLPDVSYKLV